MRNAFIEELIRQADCDRNIWLLTADIGYAVVDRFFERFPERYVNVGAAEQNMIGVAAGLALSEKTVFVYSIANFPTLRCLEQIRNDICYHNANVKIVAVGAGFAYGAQGYSHYALEDLAILRSLPNMTVVAPGDPVEVGLATRAMAAEVRGPCYLRLGKAGEPVVHKDGCDFAIGKATVCEEGETVTLVSTGGTLSLAIETARELREHGISCGVTSLHTLKPLDVDFLGKELRRVKLLCTIEEHSEHGGLGDLVAGVAGRSSGRISEVMTFAVPDGFGVSQGAAGTQSFMREECGLSSSRLARRIRARLKD